MIPRSAGIPRPSDKPRIRPKFFFAKNKKRKPCIRLEVKMRHNLLGAEVVPSVLSIVVEGVDALEALVV